MGEITKTMKLHIYPDKDAITEFVSMTEIYRQACNYISDYIFEHGFILNSVTLSNELYHELRDKFDLKSQLAQSAIRTVTARYKTVKEQLSLHPYKYKDEDGKWQYITRTLEWLIRPVHFSRPQTDLVRNRDYSFVSNGTKILVNTLNGRKKVSFDTTDCFTEYFDGTWSFGTAKLVSLSGKWYLHIPMTKTVNESFSPDKVRHVVGLDRGLRFLVAGYDENDKSLFIDGKDVLRKRNTYNAVRARLQSKGTKSAKRVLKRLSGRENRWMSDVNHQISKTLVDRYGQNTLFVIEGLADVSFNEANLNARKSEQRNQLRSWTFYQFEQFLTYKAEQNKSMVLKVPADYTSQRCPKCGRIHKENRRHETHEYICDCCGYRSNDDRIGAMNLQMLGTLYISGDENPRIRKSEN